MNSAEYEVYKAIREVQKEPDSIRYICLICKKYLSDWDTQKGYAMCWRCRSALFPTPKVEARNPEPRKPTLVQLKDGRQAIILD
jgi:DNA-directed RNA polymerase subunit RPC12/RpoP